jgi:hypothetical protein
MKAAAVLTLFKGGTTCRCLPSSLCRYTKTGVSGKGHKMEPASETRFACSGSAFLDGI